MADRTVKVVLKADVSAYVRDVAVATAATEALRRAAERFEDRYTATLHVNTTGAERDMARAEQGISRSAAKMARSMDRSGKQLQDQLAGLRKEIVELEKHGADDLLKIDADRLNREIASVRSQLSGMSGQRVSFQLASNIADARADVAKLTGELRALDRKTYEPQVRIDVEKLRGDLKNAQRDLFDSGPGSFADQLRKSVEGAYRSLPALEIRADGDPAEREIAKIRAELAALGDKRIGVDIDERSFMAQAAALQQRLRAIAATSTSVRFRADAGDAASQLDNLGRAADGAGRKIAGAHRENDRFHKGLLHTVRNAADTAHALRTITIPPALLGAAPAVASLGASLLQVGNAAAMIPGLMAGAGVGLSAVLVGLKDWADVVEQLGKGKIDKAATQAQELSVEAKKTAMALIGLAKAYDEAAEAVQDELFRGTSEELKQLAGVYLPLIKTSLASVAGEINTAAIAFSDFATRAETVQDAKDGIENVRIAMSSLAPVIVNLSTIFRDMAAVGARELPSLARNFEEMTGRWQESIARARANGDLARWIAEGRAEVNQLGRVFGNVGSIMVDFFRAGEAAGIDTLGTLERLTGRARDFMNSWQGQAQVRGFLIDLREDAAAFLPGLQALAGAALDFVKHLSNSGTLKAAGEAFSSLAESARPVIEVVSHLTNAVLRPLLGLVNVLSPALGPLIAGMVAWRSAAAAVTSVQTRLSGGMTAAGVATTGLSGKLNDIGTKAGVATLGMTGSARAGQLVADSTSKVSSALDKAGRALPVIGLALVGLGIAYDELRSKTDEHAKSVLNGQVSLRAAVDAEVADTHRSEAVARMRAGASKGAAMAASEETRARADVLAEMDKEIAKAPPLQAANLMVTKAQQELNWAIEEHGRKSPEAVAASNALKDAHHNLELQEYANRLGVDLHTAAIQRNLDLMLGAKDAELGFAQSKLRARDAIAQNGATLDLNTQKGIANQQALRDLVVAAGADLAAKDKQFGKTDELIKQSGVYREQLINTATRMGMNRDEAVKYVDSLLKIPPSVQTDVKINGLLDSLRNVNDLNAAMKELNGGTDPRIDTRSLNNNRIRLPGRASGGPISGPGTGTSDSILAMLSDGEFVIPAKIVDDLGEDKLEALRRGDADVVPAYARGGRVGRSGLPGYAAGGSVSGGGMPSFAGGGAVSGGGGLIGAAVSALRGLRDEVAATWAAVNRDTNNGFTTLASTIASRMAEIVGIAGGQATVVGDVVSGQFGRVSVDANTHFGAAAQAVGTNMTNAKNVAVTEANLLGAGVGTAFTGTQIATDQHFGAVQTTVGARMAGARATGTSEATLLQTGVAGAWGATAVNTDQQFGAVQGTVTNRMLGTQVAANTEARNLNAGVTGQWGATAGTTDQQFSGIRDTVSNRMLVTRDDANRKSNETNVGVTGAFGSMERSSNSIFTTLQDNARRKWDELKGSVDGPVRWVVNTAWNVGARALWDAAAKIFPIGAFPFAKYAIGGPVYGPGTGTSDSIPAMLSNNEHVWTEKEVKGAGGHGEVARLRAMAQSGSLAQFADGGAWRGMFGAVKKQFPSATLNSAYRPGDPGYHGRGQAIDVGGPMMAINRWIATAMPDKTELIHTPGINLWHNQPHVYNAATRADHWDHVHWATGGANAGVNGSGQGFVTFSMVDMLMDAISGPRDALRGMINKAWPKNGTLSGDLPSHAGEWIITKAEDFLRKKAEELDKMAMMGGGGGAQQWSGLASLALSMLGQPLSLLPRVLEQIMIESSGNPGIINTWDSNARRGTPSMGLIQTIMPTYRRFADPRRDLGPLDPLSNLLAGMRYAIATYGGIANIWPKRMGYHDGGAIPGSGITDDKLVLAQSGERVLTRGQNVAFERLVSVLDKPQPIPAAFRGRIAGGDGASVVNNIHNENHFREAVDLDLFNSRQDFQVRSLTF